MHFTNDLDASHIDIHRSFLDCHTYSDCPEEQPRASILGQRAASRSSSKLFRSRAPRRPLACGSSDVSGVVSFGSGTPLHSEAELTSTNARSLTQSSRSASAASQPASTSSGGEIISMRLAPARNSAPATSFAYRWPGSSLSGQIASARP